MAINPYDNPVEQPVLNTYVSKPLKEYHMMLENAKQDSERKQAAVDQVQTQFDNMTFETPFKIAEDDITKVIPIKNPFKENYINQSNALSEKVAEYKLFENANTPEANRVLNEIKGIATGLRGIKSQAEKYNAFVGKTKENLAKQKRETGNFGYGTYEPFNNAMDNASIGIYTDNNIQDAKDITVLAKTAASDLGKTTRQSLSDLKADPNFASIVQDQKYWENNKNQIALARDGFLKQQMPTIQAMAKQKLFGRYDNGVGVEFSIPEYNDKGQKVYKKVKTKTPEEFVQFTIEKEADKINDVFLSKTLDVYKEDGDFKLMNNYLRNSFGLKDKEPDTSNVMEVNNATIDNSNWVNLGYTLDNKGNVKSSEFYLDGKPLSKEEYLQISKDRSKNVQGASKKEQQLAKEANEKYQRITKVTDDNNWQTKYENDNTTRYMVNAYYSSLGKSVPQPTNQQVKEGITNYLKATNDLKKVSLTGTQLLNTSDLNVKLNNEIETSQFIPISENAKKAVGNKQIEGSEFYKKIPSDKYTTEANNIVIGTGIESMPLAFKVTKKSDKNQYEFYQQPNYKFSEPQTEMLNLLNKVTKLTHTGKPVINQDGIKIQSVLENGKIKYKGTVSVYGKEIPINEFMSNTKNEFIKTIQDQSGIFLEVKDKKNQDINIDEE